MIADIKVVKTEAGTGNPDHTEVVYTGMVNGYEQSFVLRFHFFNSGDATAFANAMELVTGVEVLPAQAYRS